MSYKTGNWGPQAKERSRRRNAYFNLYKSNRDVLKVKARNLVNYYLLAGRLERLPCMKCGSTERVEAHHEDYNKPLDIVWLCPFHHRERENQIKLEIYGVKNCDLCSKEIYPPKKKFCSDRCCLDFHRKK
jgi:predicted nucleic acid-binding Zn ribbon protein